MSRVTKKIVKVITPAAARRKTRSALNRLPANKRMNVLQTRLARIEHQLDTLIEQSNHHDNRLDKLRQQLAKVEHYQPIYNIEGLIDNPARNESKQRAWLIEEKLAPVAGKKLIDFGSSLGYFTLYFADRSAITEGWESNTDNCDASKMIQDIVGIPATLKNKELNLETIKTIYPGQFDACFILSVFHHVVRFTGIEETQQLIKEILDRIPVMFVELAKKGEDSSLPWDASQPEHELDIFDLVKDEVTITLIGEFPNHLSNNMRPVYMIEKKKSVVVGQNIYNYEASENRAYKGSIVARTGIVRRYYSSDSVLVKEYALDQASKVENEAQILGEISTLLNIQKMKIHHAPELLSYELKPSSFARLALKKVSGDLLSDLDKQFSEKESIGILQDILRSLADLEEKKLYHNDIRSWNIIVDNQNAWLIDYGLVSSIDEDDNRIALLWVANKLITGVTELTEQQKQIPPPAKNFAKHPRLKNLYKNATASKSLSFKELLDSLN
jgi:O-antigen chain-terminating methyltransferase